jgi:WD40 repeat protein
MDGTVALFDVATHKFIGVVEGHHKPVRSLTFTPGGREVERRRKTGAPHRLVGSVSV